MISSVDELVAPVGKEMGWEQQPATPSVDGADFVIGSDVLSDQVADVLALDQGLPHLLNELAVRLPVQPDVQALCVWLYEAGQHTIRLHVLSTDLPARPTAGMDFPVDDSIAGWVWEHEQPLTINTEENTLFPEFARALSQAGIRSFSGVPLMIGDRRIGVLGLASTKADAFRDLNLQFVQRNSTGSAGAAHNLPRPRNPVRCKNARHEETPCLHEQIRPEDKFDNIIGRSAALRAVFDQIQIVAPTDTTVLILGETGTGKELLASAIHNRSSRRDRPFIKLNCAAIPSGLLESELFGHERGAFTGAITRKQGRFELANGGTLFLDEIGDIPLELQAKLLRVLQEQEFERLGSTQTTRVNVRVVAATSRDISQMVANREFRNDLFYRLNVFPVRVPALRERTEDIPLLARHFVDLCARRMKKDVERIPTQIVQALLAHPWPGNVRELQNFMERAVILSPGKVLQAPVAELNESNDRLDLSNQSAASAAKTLKDAECEHIIQALAQTTWVIGGPKGAAARLGLRRTTLISKMRRLGISRAQA